MTKRLQHSTAQGEWFRLSESEKQRRWAWKKRRKVSSSLRCTDDEERESSTLKSNRSVRDRFLPAETKREDFAERGRRGTSEREREGGRQEWWIARERGRKFSTFRIRCLTLSWPSAPGPPFFLLKLGGSSELLNQVQVLSKVSLPREKLCFRVVKEGAILPFVVVVKVDSLSLAGFGPSPACLSEPPVLSFCHSHFPLSPLDTVHRLAPPARNRDRRKEQNEKVSRKSLSSWPSLGCESPPPFLSR